MEGINDITVAILELNPLISFVVTMVTTSIIVFVSVLKNKVVPDQG